MKPLRIFNHNLELLAEIDDYDSLIVTRKWHTYHTMTLTINQSKVSVEHLVKGNILLPGTDYHKTCIIRTVTRSVGGSGKGDEVVNVTAYGLCEVFTRRITLPPAGADNDLITADGETAIKHYIERNLTNADDEKRNIGLINVLPNQSRGREITFETANEQLDEVLTKISTITGLGLGMTLNHQTRKFDFDVLQGRDLTAGQTANNPVIFSPEYDSTQAQSYTHSDVEERNVAYVGDEVVGDVTGFERKELYIDPSDDMPAVEVGQNELSTYQENRTLEGQVLDTSPFKYEVDWDLGDIVTVQNKRWGVSASTRITEITEVYEPGNIRVEVTFGESLPTIIDKVKKETSKSRQASTKKINQRIDKIENNLIIPKPTGGKLWRFDTSLESTDGIKPLDGSVATLRPNEGRFGGAVAVEEATENLWGADTQWIDYQLKTSSYDHPTPTAILDNLGSHITVSYEARVTSGPNVNMQVYVRTTDRIINTYNTNPQLVDVGPEWTRVEQSVQIDDRSIDRYVWLARNPVGQVIDIRRFQVEARPFATSFVDGTRPDGILAYPISLADDHTIACYRKSHTDEGYKHIVKRSDGKVFVDGVEDSEYDVGWIAGRNLILNSTFNDKVTIYGGRGSVISKSYNKLIYQNQTGTNAGPLFVFSETLKPSTPYILSFDLKVSQDVVMNYLYLRSGMTTTAIGSQVLLLPDQNLVAGENRVAIPFTLSSPSNGIWFATNIAQKVEFELSNLQLLEGTHATHWTPAPEDLGYDGDTLMLSNQTGLIDELLVLDYEATEEEIQSWYEKQQPFYDQDEINYLLKHLQA